MLRNAARALVGQGGTRQRRDGQQNDQGGRVLVVVLVGVMVGLPS